VHTYEKGGKYVADYQNFRGLDAQGQLIPPTPGDTDRDRIRQLRQAALAVNPNMKFIVSLGWGVDSNDFGNGAKSPTEFASSVGDIVADNQLDGFDIDFERTTITAEAFRETSQALRSELDTRGKAMGKKLYLTITPGEMGFDMAAVNQHYDYLQMQSYDSDGDLEFKPKDVVGHGVASAKILFGRDIESGDTLAAKRYRIPDVVAYVTKNGLAGLMGWRVNAGSQMTGPTLFSGVKLLGQALPAD
jgi:GH18 family chitinase